MGSPAEALREDCCGMFVAGYTTEFAWAKKKASQKALEESIENFNRGGTVCHLSIFQTKKEDEALEQ